MTYQGDITTWPPKCATFEDALGHILQSALLCHDSCPLFLTKDLSFMTSKLYTTIIGFKFNWYKSSLARVLAGGTVLPVVSQVDTEDPSLGQDNIHLPTSEHDTSL